MTALKAVGSDRSAQASGFTPDTRLAAAQREFARVCRKMDAAQEAEDERELTDGELQARSDYYWPKGGEA